MGWPSPHWYRLSLCNYGGWLLDRYGSDWTRLRIDWLVVSNHVSGNGESIYYGSPVVAAGYSTSADEARLKRLLSANSRLSVQWFPNNERGFGAAFYRKAAQYISLGIIAANDDHSA